MRIIYSLIFLIVITGSYAQNAKNAFDFDGSNDYIDLDTSSAYHPAYLTVEAWINADAWRTSNWQGTILSTDTWSGTGGQRGWNLRTGDNGRATLLIAQGTSGTWMECMSAQIMSTGKWYHVAATYDGQNQRVYINGQLVQTLSNTGGIRYNGMDKMLIGDCTGQIGNRVFDGKIDEVRVWKVALDTNTLREWMFKPISSSHPQYSNRIAYYKANEASGTTAYDSSGFNHNGILTNFSATPRVSSYVPLASAPSNCLNNVAAVWSANNIATSSIMKVTDSMSSTNYVVFGHNNGSLTYNSSNKPTQIMKRLSRYWRIEKEGTLSGTNVIFNYSGLDTSGFAYFKLLIDSDTNFDNASYISGKKLGNKTISYYISNIQDSTFYTIGAYDFQTPTVYTNSITDSMAFTAKIKGELYDMGGYDSNYAGIIWSTSPNPTINLSTKDSVIKTSIGYYEINITGLSQNTKYFVRAYARNKKGMSYGNTVLDFTTETATSPTVITNGLNTKYADSVKYSGNVSSDGNVAVTERGFCWGTAASPTTSGNKVISGSGKGLYYGMLTGMAPSTTYHVRAYAINSIGTSYGADSTVTTLPILTPTVITGAISGILGDSAYVTGQITFDGRRAVTQKGFCWSTSPNPTIALSTKSTQGGGTSSFNYYINGLSINTTYHVRAYATNAVGTAYGNDSTFITADSSKVVITKVSSVSYITADVTSNVISDGRLPVTSRGVCWSTTANPTIKNSPYTASGSGTGSYLISLSGLTHNTVYHVRAYSINKVGVSYSADSTFKTLKISAPTVITSSPKSITSKGATCGGNVTSTGGAAVSLRGVCWSVNPNPTAKLSTRSVNGSGLGSYSYNITTLIRGTTYHVRAYAINSIDTAYGGDSVFTTLDAAKLTLDSVKTVDATKVNCRSTVTSDGGSNVTLRGVCWDTKSGPKPKAPAKFTTDGSGKGSYSSVVSPLLFGITYYIRAYAINGVDTAYSTEYTYVPIVVNTTTPVTSITGTTAQGGGNVVSGNNVTDRGVVWDISANPSIALSTKTSDGSGTGIFTSSITGLNPNTLYHVRAYATNSLGTAYGTDITFTTANKPAVTTGTITITSPTTATCDGNVTSDGGMTVTGRGVSWSEADGNELLLINKTSDGSGTGTYTSTLTGLLPNTTYYVRAYAINGVDTAFGIQKTCIITPPVVITGTSTNVNKTFAIITGEVNAMSKTTTCYFEYGTSTSYGLTMNPAPNSFSDNVLHSVNVSLSGLTHGTSYHYRLVAENSHGKTFGADSVFTTIYNTSIADKPSADQVIISATSYLLRVEITAKNWNTSEVIVTDLSGKEIIRQKNTAKVFVADLPIAQAIYLVTVNIDKKTFSQKIIIK